MPIDRAVEGSPYDVEEFATAYQLLAQDCRHGRIFAYEETDGHPELIAGPAGSPKWGLVHDRCRSCPM